MPEPNTNKVKTTEKSFRILELLVENSGGRISEIAVMTGLPKSTVHRHLNTLKDIEYVVSDGDIYHPSMRFASIGTHVQNRKKAYQIAESIVSDLGRETKERASFFIEEHGMSVYVRRSVGENAVLTDSAIGKQVHMHSTASGKAMLAELPEERVNEIIDRRGLPAKTENTISDKEELFDELERIRENEYSTNDQENIDGLRAVGVAVKNPNGRLIGALAVTAPTQRIKENRFNRELPDLLLGAANEFELRVEYGK